MTAYGPGYEWITFWEQIAPSIDTAPRVWTRQHRGVARLVEYWHDCDEPFPADGRITVPAVPAALSPDGVLQLIAARDRFNRTPVAMIEWPRLVVVPTQPRRCTL